jgi:hypothetical protein
MTSSDDDLAWRLKRELHAEAARLVPAQDGLSQIRAQLRLRSASRLWGGLRVDAERYGLHLRHLAAEGADWVVVQTRRVPFPGRSRGAHDDAGTRPGVVWLRPVLAVAAVCIFAGTAAAVPGLRHAITNIGSSGAGSPSSVTGHGGGSGAGTGQRISGGHGQGGTGTGTTATASPSPTSTCLNAAKPVPSVLGTPTRSGSSGVAPAVAPTTSSPAAPPTIVPASPTESPTTPTGSSDPTPTGTSAAPSGGGDGTTDSAHLSMAKPCPGPTPPNSASASSASASQLAPVIPAPVQTSARVYEPAATPTASVTPPASTSSSPAADNASTPSATSTDTGSPWSQGFDTARGCRRHPHPGC